MKITNNLCQMGFDGILMDTQISDQPIEVVVPQKTQFNAYVLHLSGNVAFKIILEGDESKCDIKIVYLSNKNNKNNIKVEVIHKHKNTTSMQQIKGVLTDSSCTVFDGIIRMPKDSQQCEGYQNHRAVLLSDKASVRATPELEIYADDVKCSHGSAVGALDKNHLFYLMARGICEKEAKKLLLKAYLFDTMPGTWEEHIDDWMHENV